MAVTWSLIHLVSRQYYKNGRVFTAGPKMSITSGLLTIVALAVVLRCSAVTCGTDWATINNCLREERNEPVDAVQCVTTQVSYITSRRKNNCLHKFTMPVKIGPNINAWNSLM